MAVVVVVVVGVGSGDRRESFFIFTPGSCQETELRFLRPERFRVSSIHKLMAAAVNYWDNDEAPAFSTDERRSLRRWIRPNEEPHGNTWGCRLSSWCTPTALSWEVVWAQWRHTKSFSVRVHWFSPGPLASSHSVSDWTSAPVDDPVKLCWHWWHVHWQRQQM